MKQFFAMGLAVTAMVVAGCTKVEPDVTTTSRYIQANASIDGAATKAPIEGTDAAITDVAFVRADDASASADATVVFTGETPFTGSSRAVGGVITFGAAQAYDQELDKTSYLLGYRPTVAPVSNVVTWTLDGKTDVMTTDVWNAGRYSLPVTTGMVFKHELARLEVICKAQAGVALSVVQAMWGNIAYIKLKDAVPSVQLSYTDKAVTPTGTPTDFSLLKADYSDVFASMLIPASNNTAVTASAMLAPIASTSITLLVKTANLEEKTITVTLDANMARAKIHQVTLTFKANGKDIECNTSTIEDWSTGATAGNDVTEPTTPAP